MQRALPQIQSRGATLVAISVDEPHQSAAWARKRGLAFPLLSDPDLAVIDAFDVRNEQAGDLPLHAVFIVNREGNVTYRKIARRRVRPDELLAALDGERLRCCPGRCDATICEPIPR
ncbi:MAG: peroxiredoxin family protein [Myxococcales bacterium FL481]|nr:MAG: peroxiredoxin family protein [Myxococcales bacterium FL481]